MIYKFKKLFLCLIGTILLIGSSISCTQDELRSLIFGEIVSISITTDCLTPVLPVGGHQSFTAIGTRADGSTVELHQFVQWQSSNPEVAKFIGAGSVNILSAGEFTVSITFGSLSASTSSQTPFVTGDVKSLQITSINPIIPLGGTYQFTASATLANGTSENVTCNVYYSSLNPEVATINPTTGVATGVSTGTTSVTTSVLPTPTTPPVTSPLVVVPVAVLQSIQISAVDAVSGSLLSLPINEVTGATVQYIATGTFSNSNPSTTDLTNSVIWTSSNTSVATITSGLGGGGLATVSGVGSTNITAAETRLAAITDTTILNGLGVFYFYENFDSVSAGSLPSGWAVTVDVGPVTDWTTVVDTAAPTQPNAVFAEDIDTTSSQSIVSPSILIPSVFSGVLSFWQKFLLESSGSNCFDGGVLEISINGGSFQDIITSGGRFVQNGYTGTIDTAFGNPLSGQAWCGTSAGYPNNYIQSIVNLPGSASGQLIRLRWNLGTDGSLGRPGWWIDNILIQ